MKKLIIAIVFVGLMAGCRTARISFRECPNGHKTVKNVPIIYGLVLAETPEEEKALIDGLKNHEFVLGGCASGSHSPKYQITCTECGLVYDERDDCWAKYSTNAASFKRPFSRYVTTFPFPAKHELTKPMQYNQRIYDGKILSEVVSYTSTQNLSVVEEEVDEWWVEHGFLKPTRDLTEKPSFPRYWSDRLASVDVIPSVADNSLNVHLRIRNEEVSKEYERQKVDRVRRQNRYR